LAYLGFQFSWRNEAEKKKNSKWTNNAYVYSFSLAVYCTAWTYYGSIGVSAKSGLNYIPIYLGPVLIFPVWIIVLKKIIRISRVNKISSIADFISLRYGNSRFLGALVTLICMVAILPYVGLQLKAISETFHVVTQSENSSNVLMTRRLMWLLSLRFASFYGTRYGDASEKARNRHGDCHGVGHQTNGFWCLVFM
jgi:Na+/proline symporter